MVLVVVEVVVSVDVEVEVKVVDIVVVEVLVMVDVEVVLEEVVAVVVARSATGCKNKTVTIRRRNCRPPRRAIAFARSVALSRHHAEQGRPFPPAGPA